MSQVSVYTCDGPTCVHTIEDIFDDDDLLTTGWFILTFQDGDDERTAHLHSLDCLEAWAQVCEREEAEAA